MKVWFVHPTVGYQKCYTCFICLLVANYLYQNLLPTGSEEREVFGVGSIPVAILPSCQDIKTIALLCREITVW